MREGRGLSRRSYSRSERRAARHHVSRRHAAKRSRPVSRARFDRHVVDHTLPIRGRPASLGDVLNTHAALLPQDGVSTQDIQPRAALAKLAPSGGGDLTLVAAARRYLGGNPTGRKSLWCARFMNMVLQQTGHRGTGSDMASSFASYGKRVSGPQVGAIAVMSRGRRGGHVGVVSGFDPRGNPIVVSGNHGRRVAESVYARSRIYAYVMP